MKLAHRRISASGRGRRRPAGRVPHGEGASLSDAAGAYCRRISPGWRRRPLRAPGGTMVVGAARPAIPHREPTGRCGNIATEAVVRAPADGYTLLLVTIPNVINATLYDRLNYNFIRDIAPVASIDRVPNVMEVHPSVPARTVPEFIAYAKANPGKINMASSGNGTSQHVAGELFKMMTGVNLVIVPYRGAGPHLSICSPDKCRSCSTLYPARLGILGRASCARSR